MRGTNFTLLNSVILLILSTLFIGTQAEATIISDALSSFYEIDSKQGEIAIMWLGNHQKGSLEGYASAGFVIKTSQNIIVIDPSDLLSDDLDALEKVDAILITHDHGDHFNMDSTIMMQKKTGAYVIANPPAFSVLSEQISSDKLVKMLPNNVNTLDGISITAFLGEHPSEMPLLYVIEVDGFRIFDGSDSAYVDVLKYMDSEVHIALVPTGDPSPSASPTDAFEMTKATKPYVVIPMHGSPEQMQRFAEMLEDSELETNVIIPKPLEIIIPAEVVPEYPVVATIMIVSFLGMISIIFILKKNKIVLQVQQ